MSRFKYTVVRRAVTAAKFAVMSLFASAVALPVSAHIDVGDVLTVNSALIIDGGPHDGHPADFQYIINGTLEINSPGGNVAANTFLNIGIGGTVNNAGVLTNDLSLANAGTVNNSGQLVNNMFLFNAATLNNPGLLFNNASMTNSAGATLNNSDTLTSASGVLTNESGGTLNNSTGGNLFLLGGTLNNDGTLNNAGTLSMFGTLNNNAGGSLINESGSTFLNDSFETFNAGAFVVEVGAALSGLGDASYTQTAGTTVVDGTFQQRAITISGGALKGSGTVESTPVGELGGSILIGPDANVDPGNSPGLLTLVGDVEFDGTLNIEVVDAGNFDLLDVMGEIEFGVDSDINFLLDNAFVPTDGLTLMFLTSDGLTGFENLGFSVNGLGPEFTAALLFDDLNHALSLGFTAVPVPAAVWLFGSALGVLGWMRRKAA